MTKQKFSRDIQEKVAVRLGAEYEVRLQTVQKNNGVQLQGMVILNKLQNVSPTIYLDDFYEAYCNGYLIERIVEEILRIYREDTPKENVDMSFFLDFESVKERICYRLIDERQNRELLEKIPHIKYLDLAICFYYSYQSEQLGNGSILIYHTHLAMWGVTEQELLRLAHENTPRLFPWQCNSMENVLDELVGDCYLSQEEKTAFFRDVPMNVLTNSAKTFGASCILYPGVLEQVALELQSGFYILPSSVHEVILLCDGCGESEPELKNMIKEVNRTQLEAVDVLSYSLYYYSLIKKQIEIL
ncbi:MAG: hypothetical protein E7287_05895 [Lachnospiraceae bacterium]|nr:hypothetical protein [Lachnospiraceae bacterium]